MTIAAFSPELAASDTAPLILTVPGLDGSGPSHWQSLWERELDNCARADLGMWDRPHRNAWANKLNHAIRGAGRPVVLVAHSLGCLAVAWWAAMERPAYGSPVIGALLVAPPEVNIAPVDSRLASFSPMPMSPLPFPSVLVASRDDPYVQLHRARRIADFWGSRFVDAGNAGHINAESSLGHWPLGQLLLSSLLDKSLTRQAETGSSPVGADWDGHSLTLAELSA